METCTGVELIRGKSRKFRELYEALKREEQGEGESPTATVTCESELLKAGVDETRIAKKLTELLDAKRPQWNPKKQAFDLFPDHRTRLDALKLIFEIRGSFRAEIEDEEGPLVINLGGIPCYNDKLPSVPSDGSERSER